MKLLVISDEADPGLWDYFSRDKLAGVDAIISCGDLPADYLSFLVTMGNIPVFYVHGNHDSSYDKKPPEGCDCIDGAVGQGCQCAFIGNICQIIYAAGQDGRFGKNVDNMSAFLPCKAMFQKQPAHIESRI